MSDPSLFVYCGHHKCASTWIIQILDQVAGYANLNLFRSWTQLETAKRRVPRSHASFSGDLIVYRNADIREVRELPPFRGFHVIRDPRDILVSAYFSHRYSHPQFPAFADQRAKLEQVDQSTGLMLEFDFCAKYLQQIATWDYNQPKVLELRYEELIRDPVLHFVRIFQFLGLLTQDSPPATPAHLQSPLTRAKRWTQQAAASRRTTASASAHTLPPLGEKARRKRILRRHLRNLLGDTPVTPGLIAQIVEQHSFENNSGGRRIGEEDQRHHYRKGIAGDWRNYFEPVHVAEFKRRYNAMLLELGYETDPDWC